MSKLRAWQLHRMHWAGQYEEEVRNYTAEFQLAWPHLSVSAQRTASITFAVSQ